MAIIKIETSQHGLLEYDDAAQEVYFACNDVVATVNSFGVFTNPETGWMFRIIKGFGTIRLFWGEWKEDTKCRCENFFS